MTNGPIKDVEGIKTYNGNPLIKRAGEKISWTPEMIEEYVRCAQDPIYFIETYMKVIHVDHGLVNFKLRPYQKEMVLSFHENRKTILCTARRAGKSSSVCGYILHYITFNSDKFVALLANKGKTAMELLGVIQLAYQNLPKWLQHGVEEWNKGSFVLENGSRVLATATSSDNIRGLGPNFVFIDECVTGDTLITVRNKKTGVERTMTINSFYEELGKSNS